VLVLVLVLVLVPSGSRLTGRRAAGSEASFPILIFCLP
jgi:hypothetical protein